MCSPLDGRRKSLREKDLLVVHNNRPRRQPLDHDPQAIILARRTLGWRQARLAKEVRISRSFLSEIEAGKRNANLVLIRRLATALTCEPAQLASSFLRDRAGDTISPSTFTEGTGDDDIPAQDH
jgi:ribosome-binding protein aMBF1 (putative translation factor)